MKRFRPLLLAGIMTAGVTALAGYAYAGEGGLKTLILQLPGGSVQTIQLAGPTQPTMLIMPPAMPAAFLAPVMPAVVPVAQQDPFAQVDRISAIMDAQAAAMMSAMNVMMTRGMPGAIPGPGSLVPAAFGPLPPGDSASYSFISATSGGSGGACMESVQITAMGAGQAPKVVSRRAGDCAGGSLFGQRPAAVVVPHVQQPEPKLIRARAEMPASVPRASQS
ncbi:MAG TPA: hypothetical protein VL752_16555 [Acidisoma sp.]|jgi:hypothetical protein|uniref:hypothetical protein n=1 Tax=Acidisoma sp. TaxID=1872115 RepID=UPI002BE89FF5|nr:hypothetical protein [Acidisoma sp.]HTI02562.1 hypothetical protein [Acidisoma sp.]